MLHGALWCDLHRVDVWELMAFPRNDIGILGQDCLENFRWENQRQLGGIERGWLMWLN